MEFSPNQKTAIFTRNKNILVSAAAGSGKTAVLVQRVMEIIKNPNINITDLLVVTFTKAAAAEMLLRIEKALTELLNNPDEPNKAHLYKQLRLLNRADVTTIDAFCTKTVRKYFYNTELEPDFAPAEEAELEEIRRQAINYVTEEAFKQYEAQNPIYAPLYSLCDMLSASSSNTLELEEEILNIYKALTSMPYPVKWLHQTFNSLNAHTYEDYLTSPFIKELLSSFNISTAESLIDEADRIMEEVFSKTTLNEEAAAIKELAKTDDAVKIADILGNIVFPRFNASKKINPEAYNKAKLFRDTAKDIINKDKALVKYFSEESYNTYKQSLPMLKLIYTLEENFINEFMRLKKAANKYEFSDIERVCLNMLVENGSPTEFAVQLKNRYVEIITDEYQDTNPLQEEILKALARENNRFMVGDIKQSIYGFRNADPAIFINKYNNCINNPSSPTDCLVHLSENYRSRKPVLDFVNLVFSQLMTPELGGVEYEELNYPQNSKYTHEKDVKTEVLIVNRYTDIKPPAEIQDEEIIKDICQSSASAEALLIAGKIKELMLNDPAVKYSDIVILSRVLTNKAESIVNTLSMCGIPSLTYKAADSTDFIENKTIISYLKIIDNPYNDLDLAAVLHSPVYRLTAEELAQVRLYGKDMSLPFYDSILIYVKNNSNGITQKLNSFLEDREYFSACFKTEPVNEVLYDIYAKTDYYNYLNLLSEGKNRRANLDKLSDAAAAYDAGTESGLYGFLNYLNNIRFEQAQIIPPENNAVKIMTIHSSKGLQFPIVFLSGIEGRFSKKDLRDKIIADKSMGICLAAYNSEERIISQTAPLENARLSHNRALAAEALRLYYVAVTRAEERLIITAADSPKKTKANTYDEIREKLIEGYSKNSMEEMKYVPPYSIINASSFLSILTTALYNRENSPVYSLAIKHWYELTGVTENKSLSVYADKIKAEKLKKADYPYNSVVALPTNVSVTEIKKEANADTYPIEFSAEKFRFTKPRFITEEKHGLSPMEEGTAYHAMLAAINYKNPPKNGAELINNCLKTGILSKEEADAADQTLADAYLTSSIAKRAENALNVYKEHSFTMGLSPYMVYPHINPDPALNDEIILTHGIIDLFFEEPDGIVIVDFKTDKSTDFESLARAYAPQLKIYKKAVEDASPKRVKEMYLYLVRHKKLIPIA